MQFVARTLSDDATRMPRLRINAGLHWGPNLYIGQLVLTDDMCRDLDLNGEDVVYQPLGTHATASETAVRDAGTIAVCQL